LDQYSGADAAKFRDWLKDKGLKSSSIQRNFSTVKAVLNLTINELGLQCNNAFSGVYLAPNQSNDKRRPLSADNIQRLHTVCLELDDDIRHLVALISDTGLRLSEAAGLMVDDLVIDHPYPHVIIRPQPHRSLKTLSSQRLVPLVGISLWAAKRVINSTSSSYCFPRYASNIQTNNNSASAAINKWLKTIAGKDAVIHGLRHSFRDRLRAVNTPTEVIDQLG
jgi:integrase